MTQKLLTIGAGMPSAYLEQYMDWLITDQRDLEIQDFVQPEALDSDWRARVRSIKSILSGYQGRMGIHGPFFNLSVAAYDPQIREVVVKRLKQSLEICAELEATHMVMHSPLSFLGNPSSLVNPVIGNQKLFDVARWTLEEIVPLAETIQCALVIENIFDKHPPLLTALVKSFESEYVRQSLDTGHAYIHYCQGAPPPDYWVREAGNALAHVHLQDTDGYSDRHWTIGKGKIDWHELFGALRELEHQPRLILELRDPCEIRKAARWLFENGLAK